MEGCCQKKKGENGQVATFQREKMQGEVRTDPRWKGAEDEGILIKNVEKRRKEMKVDR